MAVFPDRIVLKNSTDTQAAIESAIGSGGTDEITQGEIVLGIENTQVKFYTKSGNGNIVTLGGTAAGAPAMTDITDVDLSTPATDGQVLSYSSSSGNWEPETLSPYTDPLTTDGDIVIRSGGVTSRLGIGTEGQVLKVSSGLPAWAAESSAVTSVNTQTGAVSLGIEDMDDFALNTGAASITHPTRDVTVDQAGEWNAFDSGSGAAFQWGNTGALHTEMLKLQAGDSVTFNFGSGDEVHTISVAPSVNNASSYYLRVTATAWTSTMPAAGSSCTVESTRFNPSTIALADGDILQFDSLDSKFKPAQAAGVRSLLGIGEYADDTAAGTGGLSSGELYYNTTSSSYVLKT